MARTRKSSFACPNCGATVPGRAPACPECGSDEQTGWSEDTAYDGLDLPDHADLSFRRPARTRERFWQVVTVVVLMLLGLLILWGRW